MSDATTNEISSSEGRYRIGTAASLTGISTHALRVWERRYRTITPDRTPGGDRLYSDQDVDRLRLIKQLLECGHSISELADLNNDALSRLISRHVDTLPATPQPDPGLLDVREAFMEALSTLELETAERVLARAAVSLNPRSLIFDIIVPILAEIGQQWERGELRIAHEHAASVILRNLLGALMRTLSADDDAPNLVVTAPANEVHEFGALLSAMIAVSSGWRVTYLGPNLPAEEIAHVVQVRCAPAAVLSLVLRDEPSRKSELRKLGKLVSADIELIVGGPAADEAAAWLPRAHRVASLNELEGLLKTKREKF